MAEPADGTGENKAAPFNVTAHKRPLTAEEEQRLGNLNFAQVGHLIQRFRAEIAAESQVVRTSSTAGRRKR